MVEGVPILVFARTPVPGQVKTRLIPALGRDGAARLHEQLTTRAVATAVQASIGPVHIWCTPTVDHPLFSDLRRTFGVQLFRQNADDLGRRMHGALVRTLKEFSCAIVIGSDCPFLTIADLQATCEALAEGTPAVLGPALDGGYFLIALAAPAPSLFENVPWGTDEVLEITRDRLRQLDWTWHELAPRRDIDRSEDLDALDNSFLVCAQDYQ